MQLCNPRTYNKVGGATPVPQSKKKAKQRKGATEGGDTDVVVQNKRHDELLQFLHVRGVERAGMNEAGSTGGGRGLAWRRGGTPGGGDERNDGGRGVAAADCR